MHRTTRSFGTLSVTHQWTTEDRVCRPPRRSAGKRRFDTLVISFIKHGRLILRGKGGPLDASSGDCIIFNADWLREVTCERAEQRKFEQTYVVLTLPPAVAAETLSAAIFSSYGEPCPHLRLAEKLLKHLAKPQGQMLDDTQEILAKTVSSLIANSIRSKTVKHAKPATAEVHFNKVLRYIQVHLSNPNLSVQKVSSSCDISPRYLSHILRWKGTSYGQLVWGLRLERAREWLSEPLDQDTPVSEIAYSLGFKSAAHFTRQFKKRYGVRPTHYRIAALETGKHH